MESLPYREQPPYTESTREDLWSGRVVFDLPAADIYSVLPQILQMASKIPVTDNRQQTTELQREVRLSGYVGDTTTTSFYQFTNNTRPAYREAVREAYAFSDDPYYGYAKTLERLVQIAQAQGVPVRDVIEMRGASAEPLSPQQPIAYRIPFGLKEGYNPLAPEHILSEVAQELTQMKDRMIMFPGRIFAYGVKDPHEENIALILGTNENDIQYIYRAGKKLQQEILIVELPAKGVAYTASLVEDKKS